MGYISGFDFRVSQRYDYRLMNSSTPGFVDPYKMAKNKQSLHDKLAVTAMSRANKLLASEQGEVEYTLSFDVDADNWCFINGELSGKLTMRCERCLQIFQKEVAGSFQVSPVKDDEEARALPSPYEPVVVVDAKLHPAELIEDELILALPIAPMHDEICVEVIATDEDEQQVLNNPFQILQTLNVKKKDQ